MTAEQRIGQDLQEVVTPSFQDFISKHIDLDYVYGIDPALNLAVGRKTTDHSSMRGGNVHRQYFSASSEGAMRPFFASAILEIGEPNSLLDFRVLRQGEDPTDRVESTFSGGFLEGGATVEFPLADSSVLARYRDGILVRIEAVRDGKGKANTSLEVEDGGIFIPDADSGIDVKYADGRFTATKKAELVSVPRSIDIDALKAQLMPEEIRADNVNVDPVLDSAWAEADLLALFDVRQEPIPQLRK